MTPEYERRFKARNTTWTQAEAEASAEVEYEEHVASCDPEDVSEPEDDADECLSYWDDDGL